MGISIGVFPQIAVYARSAHVNREQAVSGWATQLKVKLCSSENVSHEDLHTVAREANANRRSHNIRGALQPGARRQALAAYGFLGFGKGPPVTGCFETPLPSRVRDCPAFILPSSTNRSCKHKAVDRAPYRLLRSAPIPTSRGR